VVHIIIAPTGCRILFVPVIHNPSIAIM